MKNLYPQTGEGTAYLAPTFYVKTSILFIFLVILTQIPLQAKPWSIGNYFSLNRSNLNTAIFEGGFGLNVLSNINLTPEVDCLNEIRYPSGTISAPTDGVTKNISTCNYGGEYAEINQVVAGREYRFNSSVNTDYFTIRQGSYNGTIVTQGVVPITLTAATNANLYVHVNSNANCGTNSTCRTTTR